MARSFGDRVRARVARWLDVSLRESHVLRGVPVIVENERPDIATGAVLERLDEALALIEQYRPWSLRHLRRDVRSIFVVRYPCRGAYIPGERTIVTELTFLARRDISAAVVASSIVHEGVHARADRMRARLGGVWREADRAREERLCRRAELEFGRALPPALGAPVIERAMAMFELADEEVAPSIDWAVAQARQDAVDREAARE